jgi:hypothetical protein
MVATLLAAYQWAQIASGSPTLLTAWINNSNSTNSTVPTSAPIPIPASPILGFVDILNAVLRSLGTAATMAMIGWCAGKLGYVTPAVSKGLGHVGMKITIPALLFTTILDCTQNWTHEPCPDIRDTMKTGWQLTIFPIWYVGVGFALGKLMTLVTRCPPAVSRGVVGACAIGNSTGIPITLLKVIHESFPPTSKLGLVNPVRNYSLSSTGHYFRYFQGAMMGFIASTSRGYTVGYPGAGSVAGAVPFGLLAHVSSDTVVLRS